MKEIGEALRNKREELGLTIDEVSSRIKISTSKITAIENGDIGFFENNLSYLKYYVRFYCKELDFDYNEIKNQLSDDIDAYNKEINDTKLLEIDQMQKNINERIKTHTNVKKHEKKKIDISFFLILLMIILLIVAFIFGGYKLIQSGIFSNNDNGVVTETPIVVDVVNTPEPTSTPEATVTVAATINVEQETAAIYNLTGYDDQQEVTIKVEFAHETWARVIVDNIVKESPATAIYNAGDSIELVVNATLGMDVEIHLGYYKGNVIKINDQVVTLDSSIKDLEGGQKIHFIFN